MRWVCLFLMVLLLMGNIQQKHRSIIALNRGAAVAPPSCDLLSDTMENTDGVNASTHGWTADGTDPGDNMEIDTAQMHGGSSAMLFNHIADTNNRHVYRLMTAQTSGKWTISVWFYRTTVTTGKFWSVVVPASTSLANTVINVRSDGANMEYDSGGGNFQDLCVACVTAATWHRLEIEVDEDTNTFHAWLNSTQIATALSHVNTTVNAARIYIRKLSSNNTDTQTWLDDLCVYDGPRV